MRLFRIYGFFIDADSYPAIGRARQNLFLRQSGEFAGHGRQAADIPSPIALEVERIAVSFDIYIHQFVDAIAVQVNRNDNVHIEPRNDFFARRSQIGEFFNFGAPLSLRRSDLFNDLNDQHNGFVIFAQTDSPTWIYMNFSDINSDFFSFLAEHHQLRRLVFYAFGQVKIDREMSV